MDRFPHSGELDVEGSAFAWRGANVNFSSMLFDYSVADGEGKAGAAAAGFGGEKGIEDAMDVLARNAGAGVGDFDFDAAVVSGGAHFQHSASGHGVASIQEEIEKYLLKFIGRSTHRGQRLPQLLHTVHFRNLHTMPTRQQLLP